MILKTGTRFNFEDVDYEFLTIDTEEEDGCEFEVKNLETGKFEYFSIDMLRQAKKYVGANREEEE